MHLPIFLLLTSNHPLLLKSHRAIPSPHTHNLPCLLIPNSHPCPSPTRPPSPLSHKPSLPQSQQPVPHLNSQSHPFSSSPHKPPSPSIHQSHPCPQSHIASLALDPTRPVPVSSIHTIPLLNPTPSLPPKSQDPIPVSSIHKPSLPSNPTDHPFLSIPAHLLLKLDPKKPIAPSTSPTPPRDLRHPHRLSSYPFNSPPHYPTTSHTQDMSDGTYPPSN
uniref:Extensin-like n=1 Tax=Knipowitschia caucasica TaxID=637954 RepID=A0AAV2LE16_KNICA